MIITAHITAFLSLDKKFIYIVIFSFIIPWTIGLFLYFKDKKTVVTIAPFSAMMAFALNTVGIDLGYFHPLHSSNFYHYTVAIFPNTGLLPVESCIFIYAVRHTRINPFILNLVLSPLGMLIDHLFITAGLLEYNKGWNLLLSFLVYYMTFTLIYFYYLWIRKIGVVAGS